MSTRSSLSLSALLSLASVAAAGPCDAYAAGRTPCVAAHSTTRALFNSYDGPLYQVMRTSDNATTNIKPMSAGGVANSAKQDKFCANADCVITVIYDQTTNNNDLTPAPPGGAASGPGPNGYDLPTNASAAPAYLDGHKVYGVYIEPGYGYRNDDTVGVAINNEPESIYDVVDGTRYNGECCFDYGNAEINNLDNGDAHMEAVYFGLGTFGGTGAGSGPWVLADLENGLYSKGGGGVNANEPTVNDRFVTGMVKGARANHWEIAVGNAQGGKLDVVYAGPRPSGYYPMRKEGAIILGIGGDNSNSAIGTWYEGAMTSGFASSKTDNRVQANIVAAGYSDTA